MIEVNMNEECFNWLIVAWLVIHLTWAVYT